MLQSNSSPCVLPLDLSRASPCEPACTEPGPDAEPEPAAPGNRVGGTATCDRGGLAANDKGGMPTAAGPAAPAAPVAPAAAAAAPAAAAPLVPGAIAAGAATEATVAAGAEVKATGVAGTEAVATGAKVPSSVMEAVASVMDAKEERHNGLRVGDMNREMGGKAFSCEDMGGKDLSSKEDLAASMWMARVQSRLQAAVQQRLAWL
ncbi:hypothetical protein CLOM_g6753 [Closterium sp. NIES-68]|nr:hypothetical protein CLOM_g6753 [Closterium sp. NIES-68]